MSKTTVVSQKSAVIRIHFEDNGQDFLWWDVDEHGNVLDCGPFQASIWVGCIILDPEDLQRGSEVEFVNKSGDMLILKHKVDRVSKGGLS